MLPDVILVKMQNKTFCPFFFLSFPTWEQVYINKDMTKTEREQDFKLRMELKNRKDQGEKNLRIWRGKIVTRKTEQAQGQRGQGDLPRKVDRQEL